MKELNIMLLVLVTAFLLLGIGFSRRDKEWGVVLIAMGVICVLATIGYRIRIALG
ncbi:MULTISPECIES: hypothetical protein [Pseudomonadaceae]|jgi:hypothetical protein|uniref:hypothetical protein n=1 Tax=Pseudomonadaceae TaxID=135621 RepID=UPI000AE9AE8A|nr:MULTISPECIES: hypothetical protein [Pseudomonas]MBG6882726.1 hypothetical protein [Pseudomonas aeruginosa]MBV5858644.1 hypothetical protein [Pseudomonas aeruginosa]MCS9083358.1 hypothetical protein [Pseudomonas aeruginosa]MCT0697493.1 hypothetical protein [Pseudomonas aeruginosa]MCU9208066.1 hypothetical protein [Pseudomonas aeruginosa]